MPNSKAVASFWSAYDALPNSIRKAADKQFLLWRDNPEHPSLHFKKVGDFWSARVTDSYHALAVRDDETFVWFFIGTHADYERLLN